jgi:hypothetical protein
MPPVATQSRALTAAQKKNKKDGGKMGMLAWASSGHNPVPMCVSAVGDTCAAADKGKGEGEGAGEGGGDDDDGGDGDDAPTRPTEEMKIVKLSTVPADKVRVPWSAAIKAMRCLPGGHDAASTWMTEASAIPLRKMAPSTASMSALAKILSASSRLHAREVPATRASGSTPEL